MCLYLVVARVCSLPVGNVKANTDYRGFTVQLAMS